MRYYYKDIKGNLFNFKSEHFVKYKEVTETITVTDENFRLITETVTKTVPDGLEDGYTQITEEEFNELSKLPELTKEQKAKIEKATQIAELKKKLADTDYIVLKIAEAQADEETKMVAELKTIYATELVNRKAWRKQINELEG